MNVPFSYAYDETNWLDSVTDAVSGAVITYSYDNKDRGTDRGTYIRL